MSAPLRNDRVALAGAGARAVWVTAESRCAACELAARLLIRSRSVMSWPDLGIAHMQILDEYEEADAA